MIHQPNKDRTTTPPKGSGSSKQDLTNELLLSISKYYKLDIDIVNNVYYKCSGLSIDETIDFIKHNYE